MQAKTFFLAFVICVLVLSTALAGFNWLINPILLFASPRVNGLNQHKSQWFLLQLTAKPYAVRRRQPDALLMGTSRAGFMLDPNHPAWEGFDSYNYALAGTTTMVQWHSFQHAQRLRPVRRILLGLDFFMFNACRPQTAEPAIVDYLERLAAPAGRVNWALPRRMLDDYASHLLTLEVSRKSWRTIAQQATFKSPGSGLIDARDDGFWHKSTPAGSSIRRAFTAIEGQYIGTDWFPPPGRCYSLGHNGEHIHLDYLRKLLQDAQRQDTEVFMYFSPFHARLAEAMRAVGLWSQFEQLKREVVQINESVALEAGKPAFSLWDFSGYNQVNTEIVPPAGDRLSRMRWYYDGTHGTAELGQLVQDRIFGRNTIEGVDPASFGSPITAENIEGHMQTIRQARKRYLRDFPQEVSEVRKIAARRRPS